MGRRDDPGRALPQVTAARRWPPGDRHRCPRGRGRPAHDRGDLPRGAGDPPRRPAYAAYWNTSWPPSVSTVMVSPPTNWPDRIRCASGFSSWAWIARFSGRAP